jgi:cytochrome P450
MTARYDLFDPEVRIDPYPLYRRLREQDPVQFVPASEMWFVTRYADCQALLRDPRLSAKHAQRLRQRAVALAPSMLTTDPPEHTRLRGAACVAWSAAALNDAQPRLQAIVHGLLASLEARPEFDLIADYANLVAVRSLAAMLGIPEESCVRFHQWLIDCSGNVDPVASPRAQEKGAAAAARMRRYFAAIVDERRGAPERDILSTLAQTAGGTESLTHDEVLEMCNLLVIGGYEPLANLIGNGMLALFRHPAELERLRAEPVQTRGAIEELLRFDSPIQFVARVATEDVALGDRVARKGQSVLLLLGSANHDPEGFNDPARLDLSRAPNPHLSFGAGPHVCFGASFIRVVAHLAITTIVQRLPTLRMASKSVDWRPSLVPRGLAALPVTSG